ncbi:hypothetical protein L6R53_08585 [Myxococcota bacterium]|nr:hypothetical protein [Myxococcota bacterium]
MDRDADGGTFGQGVPAQSLGPGRPAVLALVGRGREEGVLGGHDRAAEVDLEVDGVEGAPERVPGGGGQEVRV